MKGYLLLVVLLAGCVDESRLISGCESIADSVSLCGWQSPEEVESLPDG